MWTLLGGALVTLVGFSVLLVWGRNRFSVNLARQGDPAGSQEVHVQMGATLPIRLVRLADGRPHLTWGEVHIDLTDEVLGLLLRGSPTAVHCGGHTLELDRGWLRLTTLEPWRTVSRNRLSAETEEALRQLVR